MLCFFIDYGSICEIKRSAVKHIHWIFWISFFSIIRKCSSRRFSNDMDTVKAWQVGLVGITVARKTSTRNIITKHENVRRLIYCLQERIILTLHNQLCSRWLYLGWSRRAVGPAEADRRSTSSTGCANSSRRPPTETCLLWVRRTPRTTCIPSEKKRIPYSKHKFTMHS